MRLLRSINPAIAGLVVVALIAAALVMVFGGTDTKTVTAEFPRTVSLFEGSDVKILGVGVGKVDEVKPAGTKVDVTFHYDAKYKVPADAKAVVISPSIVGDRYIQLTPIYSGSGAVLADGAELGLDRTATPLELDEIFGSLNDLTKALGPDGANKPDATGEGALTRLLDSTARNFGGQGIQFNRTLKNLSDLSETLANNKDNLFGTAQEINTFTQALAANDETVRRFNDSLASGADLLADEREELAAVLQNLGVALREVRGFVADNKDLLTHNIAELTKISNTVVKNRDQLDDSLTTAPVALNNLALAYDENAGTLDTRAGIGETAEQLVNNPTAVLCALLPDVCGPITSILGILGVARVSPKVDGGTAPGTTTHVVEPVDPTLAGLVEAQR